jgi:serine/threonine protein kinase
VADISRRVQQIVELALSVPPEQRARRVADACGNDQELRREIDGLLALYDARSPGGPSPSSPFSSPTTFSPDPSGALGPEGLGTDVSLRVPAVRASGLATAWGGFTLLEELGRGGFGVVYRAWDAALRRDVALKIIDVRRLPRATEDAVLREGQMMARVRHLNVVTVYSAQRIGHEIGLAMEHIKGRTLAALVAEDGPLSAYEAALIGMVLCDALAAVHRLGLVHRDLKPSNVMRENGGRIVLMDFGAGHEIGVDADARPRILGTPVFMPPEILLGSRGTPLSDLYSLGVLLYNLVTNDYPVSGAHVDELRLAHIGGDRVPLAERRPELPARFVAAVEKALSPDPAHRQPSAVAFKRELAEAMPHLAPDSGARRRLRASAPPAPARPVVDTTVPATSTVSDRANLLQRFIVALGGAFVFCSALGFLTTMQFNVALGRTGGFASEGVWNYPIWGARALLAPVVWITLLLLVLNVLTLIVNLLMRLVPPVGRKVTGATHATTRYLNRVGLTDPNSLAQALSVGGFLALVAIVWSFRTLLGALIVPVDRAPATTLVALSEPFSDVGVLMRRILEALILGLSAGAVRVMRQRRAGATVHTGSLVGVLAAIGLALLLLIAPWRLMFQADFEQATFDGHSCYVIGEEPGSVLVHCPDMAPPRNTIVAANDARLRRTSRIGNLFDGYVTR